jgi:hypothetical protein
MFAGLLGCFGHASDLAADGIPVNISELGMIFQSGHVVSSFGRKRLASRVSPL